MTEWEENWRENYKSPKYNPVSGRLEEMSLNEYQRNRYEQKTRCIFVLMEIREKIEKYESWKRRMGPGATYMDGKVCLLKQDLAAWDDYSKRLFAAASGESIWFDPALPRNIYFG